jgi:hypothetical protein
MAAWHSAGVRSTGESGVWGFSPVPRGVNGLDLVSAWQATGCPTENLLLQVWASLYPSRRVAGSGISIIQGQAIRYLVGWTSKAAEIRGSVRHKKRQLRASTAHSFFGWLTSHMNFSHARTQATFVPTNMIGITGDGTPAYLPDERSQMYQERSSPMTMAALSSQANEPERHLLLQTQPALRCASSPGAVADRASGPPGLPSE